MKTLFLLMAAHDGRAVIPLAQVAKTYFECEEVTLLRKIRDGKIRLPVLEMEDSQKGARGVHVADLAEYIDTRRDVARKIAG